MIRETTSEELEIILRDGQWAELGLAILPAITVYTARLDDLPTTSDQVAEITYISGSGTLSNVKVGMTLLVGSSPGAEDLGIGWIRKTPTSVKFFIGEQSKIDWQASAYLTVIHDHDYHVKHPRIVGTTIFMDYDVSYSDQHTNFNPVPILGNHRVGRLISGTVNLVLGPETDKNSYVFDSTISGVSWSIPTASAISSTTAVRPTVTFTTTGWHACYCTVTAANGKSTTGMRWVYIWDDDPFTDFTLQSWEENLDTGETTFSVEIYSPISFRKRALCILFSTSHYGDEQVDLGLVSGSENILGIGRITEETENFSDKIGLLTITAAGPSYWMGKLASFPVGVEFAKNTPSKWTSLPKLTVDRGLWHALYWRSNFIEVADFYRSGDSRYISELSSGSSSLWNQLHEFSFRSIQARFSSDPLGRLFVRIDPQLIPVADRDTITVITLTQDHLTSITVEENPVPEVALVDLSGISINESGVGSSHFALAPGHIFDQHGNVEIVDNLAIVDRDQIVELAGLYLGWRQNPTPVTSVELSTQNPFVVCVPPNYVEIDLPALTPTEETITGRYIPRTRSISRDADSGLLQISVQLEAETFPTNSVSYIPPAGDDVTFPPLDPFPPLPPYVPGYGGDPSAEADGPARIALLDFNKGLLFTDNFNAPIGDQIYQFSNAGIDLADIPLIDQFFITPNGSVWVAAKKSGLVGIKTVYAAAGLGGYFTKLIDTAWLVGELGSMGLPQEAYIDAIWYNPTKPEEIGFVAVGGASANIFVGNHSGFTKGASYGASGTGKMTYSDGKWLFLQTLFSDFVNIRRFSGNGATLENTTGVFVDFVFDVGIFTASTSKTSYLVSDSAKIQKTADVGTSFSSTVLADVLRQKIWMDPTGQYMMGTYGTTRKGKSSDFGTTWSDIGNLPVLAPNSYAFSYCGGVGVNSRWIAGFAVLFYSNNFGTSWVNRQGNLPYLIPFYAVKQIQVPGFINK